MSTEVKLSPLDKKKLELKRQRARLAEMLRDCFMASNLKSRPQGTVLEAQMDTRNRGQWIVAANASGKTTYGTREIAWWFLGCHPFKPRLKEWGSAPLTIIVSGKTTTIVQQAIWKEKLKPLIEGNFVIEKEDSECIRHITNPDNGNQILFLIHNDAEHARERMQAFTVHVAWIDEMPDHSSYLSEMLMRLRAGDKLDKDAPLMGYFYATFTPLVEDEGVRVLVDSCTYPFKKYVFQMEDNPVYDGWSSEELDVYIRARCQDEVEFRARRYGEWYYHSDRAFKGYDPARNRKKLPFQYNPDLQHALIVDPAASGKVGVSLAVMQPAPVIRKVGGKEVECDVWWIVVSRKVDGAAASLLVKQIEYEFVEKRKVKLTDEDRICDCSPSGFYKEARVQKIRYRPYRLKNDRKKETIEETNVGLYNELLMIADTPETEELHKELLSAKWKDNESEIKNSHKFHCSDTLRYLNVFKPRRRKEAAVYESWGHALKAAWENEKELMERKKEAAAKKRAALPQRRNTSALMRNMKYGRR